MKITILLTCFCLWLSVQICPGQSATTARQWEVCELTLRADQTYDNPYTDVRVRATFTAPDGSSIKTSGFWDGAGFYKIRFTPTRPGRWTYTLTSNQPTDRGLQKQGILQAQKARPGQHGFLRRDAENRGHFVYDDGTRYFMWGTTYYNMILNALAGDRWKVAIDSAMGYGFNKIRLIANSDKSGKTPYARRQPFASHRDSLDYDRLDIAYWRALDEIIGYANERGMIVDLIVFGYGADVYSTGPQEERYLRHALARYAAYPNVIWCLVNEWNYMERDYGKDKAYWNHLGQLVRAEDPWMQRGNALRPLSIHQQTRIDFQFFDADWPVHAIVQYGVRNSQTTRPDEWSSTDRKNRTSTHFGDVWGNQSITHNLGHDMPVVNDEYGYIGEPHDRSASTSTKRDDWPPFTREKHRQVSWGIALAGGYGSTGDKNEYADGSPYFSANWHSGPPEYRDMQHLIAFFTQPGLAYWKMHSQNQLVTHGERVYALAEPGQQYVFYAAVGGLVGANLPAGHYQTWLYDPRTGAYRPAGSSRGGTVTFSLPDTRDWVLYLTTSKNKKPIR